MSYEPRDNTAVLFKNDKKEKDSHPDYKGHGLIGNTEFWLSAWIKQGKGGKFLSISLTHKDEREKPTGKTHGEMKRGSRPHVDDDSDVPF